MNEDMKNMINLNDKKVEKKIGSTKLRSVFATFMAGAVVVGGLMFTSDKMNLFGYDAQPVQSGVAAAAANSAAADVQTASITPLGTKSSHQLQKLRVQPLSK
ncbi:hypothetical protein QFZ81_002897 [Paenibacillus sp. V4I9]|uniref:hypothetical protein n=1 Tax=Paenibacillus sp. V4I9 TaxID=3042308 RepID=UPI00278AC2D4|nr:hypothetical protein [Paenibacillus sp. V4I9]MDQ0887809.1 hypothetical protein [Paenibacillus sp. V4I9]